MERLKIRFDGSIRKGQAAKTTARKRQETIILRGRAFVDALESLGDAFGSFGDATGG